MKELGRDRDLSRDLAASSPPVSCTVFRDFTSLERLRAAWDEAVLEGQGSVYMTFEWLRLWWEFYGAGGELRLFVFSSRGRIVALVPLYLQTLGVWPLRLRVARIVGANIPPKVFNPPVPAWCAEEVFDHVIRVLFCEDGCDLLSFGPISQLEAIAASLESSCQRDSGHVQKAGVVRDVHSVFHLPASIEEYYVGLGKKQRKKRGYESRLLSEECDPVVDIVSGPQMLVGELERFAELHALQWQAEGRAGHFGAWPRALEFHRLLLAAVGSLVSPRFVRISSNGRILASQYTFAFGDRCYWELPARAVGPKWDRLSLGPAGLVALIEHAIANGMSRVEGGLGHYDYKLRLGAVEYEAVTYRIVAARLPSRWRFTVFSFFRRCLSVAYHKLWYRRIMPLLLPALHRPQWRLWLRFDF